MPVKALNLLPTIYYVTNYAIVAPRLTHFTPQTEATSVQPARGKRRDKQPIKIRLIRSHSALCRPTIECSPSVCRRALRKCNDEYSMNDWEKTNRRWMCLEPRHYSSDEGADRIPHYRSGTTTSRSTQCGTGGDSGASRRCRRRSGPE